MNGNANANATFWYEYVCVFACVRSLYDTDIFVCNIENNNYDKQKCVLAHV